MQSLPLHTLYDHRVSVTRSKPLPYGIHQLHVGLIERGKYFIVEVGRLHHCSNHGLSGSAFVGLAQSRPRACESIHLLEVCDFRQGRHRFSERPEASLPAISLESILNRLVHYHPPDLPPLGAPTSGAEVSVPVVLPSRLKVFTHSGSGRTFVPTFVHRRRRRWNT